MSVFFRKFLISQETAKPLLLKRYIDDIFMVWTESEEKLLSFINAANENIKFWYEFSSERADFLDVTFMTYETSQGWKFCCKTFSKPLNLFQYVHTRSNAPKHHIKSLIVGECVRYARTSTTPSRLYHMVSLFIKRLTARGHRLETTTKWVFYGIT